MLIGAASVTVPSGETESVLITVGKSATASGRIVFKGAGHPADSPGNLQLPLMPADGRRCSAGRTVIAPDWSFTVDGLMGTCTTRTYQAGRWMLKSVLYNGENLLDRPITFKPGADYHDLQVVLTDRRTDIAFVVTAAGQPTREYVAVVFPASRAGWTGGPAGAGFDLARVYVPPSAGRIVQDMRETPGSPREPASDPARREVMQGLRPGEYSRLPWITSNGRICAIPRSSTRLAAVATKVVVGDAARVELSLRRIIFADVIR